MTEPSLREALQDMADHGLRCDLNPTHKMGDWEASERFWHAYAKRMDESIRERAKAALAANPEVPTVALPVAWRIDLSDGSYTFHAHNPIGDYRLHDPKATSTPLYTAAPEQTEAQRAEGWVPVSERLPAMHQSVALICASRWENCSFDRNVHECGYLEDYGTGFFWSTRNGSQTIESFTHWMPLPPVAAAQPPKEAT